LPPDIYLVGNKHRHSAPRGLCHGYPEVLAVRWEYQRVSPTNRAPFAVSIEWPHPMNPFSDRRSICHLLEGSCGGSFSGTGDHQSCLLLGQFLFERSQEKIDAFLLM